MGSGDETSGPRPGSTDRRIVDLDGDGSSRGAGHGEQLREAIAEGLARWREQIADREGRHPADYVRDFLGSTSFVRTVAERSPDLYDEVRAIAAASRQPEEDVLAYNFMDEEWRHDRAGGGCSVIGTVVGDGRTVLLGQNMDLPVTMAGTQAVLRIAGSGERPEQLVVTAAGMIGLLGVNAAGVACCVNTLNALPSGRSGMPVAFLVRGVLARRDAASAADYLTSVPHASGQHFAVADPSGLRGFECAAPGCAPGPAAEHLLHTNHPLWWTGPTEAAPADSKHVVTTHARLRALRDGLDPVRRSGDVRPLLSSTGSGLCVLPTPARQSATFCSAEFTLTSPPRVRIALGRPDREPWRTLNWLDSNVA
jgi:hypothetical protein